MTNGGEDCTELTTNLCRVCYASPSRADYIGDHSQNLEKVEVEESSTNKAINAIHLPGDAEPTLGTDDPVIRLITDPVKYTNTGPIGRTRTVV